MSYSNHDIRKTIASFNVAGKGIMRMYESLLGDYWERDSHSPKRVEFMLSIMQIKTPRLAKQAAVCLSLHLPVTVKQDKATQVYSVVNRKGTTKGAKKAFQHELIKLKEAKHTSLFNISKAKNASKLKVFNKDKSLEKFEGQLQELLNNNVDWDEINAIAIKLKGVEVKAKAKAIAAA